MTKNSFLKQRVVLTAIVTVAIWALLIWNYYHGGVPRHHILNRKDLPEISNWWGGLLLPLLTLFLAYRIQQRVVLCHKGETDLTKYPRSVIFGFIGALLFGILLCAFYTFGYSSISGYMIKSLFLLALFVPIYQSEFLLGFVIGMTFTFGAVLPTAIGSIFVLIGLVIYQYIRRAILFIAKKFG